MKNVKQKIRREDKIKKILKTALFTVIMIITINSFVSAKYLLENQFTIANLNIDRTKPVIEVTSINNNNTGYENYANKTHTIKIKVKITEENIKQINMDNEHVKVKVGNENIDNSKIKISKIDDKLYEIELNNLDKNGKLYLEIAEKTAIDLGELSNDYIEIDTNILIDNIAPTGTFTEEQINNGKVNGIINLSEEIRKLEGWDFTEKNKAKKEFTNNVSYQIPITDYAGNKGVVEVNITKATYINLIYASHNSNIGWTFGYGNYDIAGKRAIRENPTYKTEALAFNINGNIDKDFVQARAFVYTHWGEGSYGICDTSGLRYKYGYNPDSTSYKSMNSSDLVKIGDKKYFQFGGAGINSLNQTDENGRNPIPDATGFPYGISSINFKLKDYSYYSIVYQVLVNKVGWVATCSDGQECKYSRGSPISAFRIALIPKTEKQYIIDTWNKDIGTYNVK